MDWTMQVLGFPLWKWLPVIGGLVVAWFIFTSMLLSLSKIDAQHKATFVSEGRTITPKVIAYDDADRGITCYRHRNSSVLSCAPWER